MQRNRKFGIGDKREFFRKYSPIGSSFDLLKDVQKAHALRNFSCDDSHHRLVFDPTGRVAHYWSGVVSLAVAYYMWSATYRWAFSSGRGRGGVPQSVWLFLDAVFYAVFLLDVLVQMRTSFLKDGILQTDLGVLYRHHVRTPHFWLDLVAALPFDVAYMAARREPAPALLHAAKLPKYYRFLQFSDRTETRSHLPNLCRTLFVIHNLLVLIHWNACLYFLISGYIGFGYDGWVYPAWNDTGPAATAAAATSEWGTASRQYIYSFYWSALTLTTIGELPGPQSSGEYLFVTLDFLVGVLMFATLVGDIGSIIENMQKTRMKFQSKMDHIKRYMKATKVPSDLQDRVIKWFDYLWSHGHTVSDDQQALSSLPDKLKAEIGMHVHFETLKKVEFFQECEGGLLWELVLRLRTQVYSPGEYVCRKGDVGREMYIVNRGRLEVMAEEGANFLKELVPGEYFGEISILNLGQSQHRRTAFVRSVGYSDLLCLTQADLMDVLKDYPQTLSKLKDRGTRTLRRDSAAPFAGERQEPAAAAGRKLQEVKSRLSPVVISEEETVGDGEDSPPSPSSPKEGQSLLPEPLLSMADQVITMHVRLAKLESTLEQLLLEVRKSRPAAATDVSSDRQEPSLTKKSGYPNLSRKLSSVF